MGEFDLVTGVAESVEPSAFDGVYEDLMEADPSGRAKRRPLELTSTLIGMSERFRSRLFA